MSFCLGFSSGSHFTFSYHISLAPSNLWLCLSLFLFFTTLVFLKSIGNVHHVFLVRLWLSILGKSTPEVMLCLPRCTMHEGYPVTRDLWFTSARIALALKAWLRAAHCGACHFPLLWEKGNLCLQQYQSAGPARTTIPYCPNLPPVCEAHAWTPVSSPGSGPLPAMHSWTSTSHEDSPSSCWAWLCAGTDTALGFWKASSCPLSFSFK